MTQEEFDKKWKNTDPWDLEEDKLREFKEDSFQMWESIGFREKFKSIYDDNEPHNGTKFKKIRRATEEEFDLICMPAWLIEFENGEEAFCYPDEICEWEKRK